MNILIMAASRKGVEDSVAKMQDKSHKCLVTIGGEVMLVQVIKSCLDCGHDAQIYISIESEEPLRTVPQLSRWLDEKVIQVVPSHGNLADSVLAAVEHMETPFPLMITTGDNVLHHGQIVGDFISQFKAGQADIAVAFTEAQSVNREAPDVQLAYHRLKDGAFSACNLYGLRGENALRAIRIFEGGGQFGKRHLRILKAFGVMPFIYYKFRLLGLKDLMSKIGANLGVTVDTLILDYPEGPIDVDNPQFFAIAERMLRLRAEQS